MKAKFNKHAYNACDERGKEAVRKFLSNAGVYTISGDENYKVDIRALREEHHEVEMKLGWSQDWTWDTLHIPVRKKKFIQKDKKCFFGY